MGAFLDRERLDAAGRLCDEFDRFRCEDRPGGPDHIVERLRSDDDAFDEHGGRRFGSCCAAALGAAARKSGRTETDGGEGEKGGPGIHRTHGCSLNIINQEDKVKVESDVEEKIPKKSVDAIL